MPPWKPSSRGPTALPEAEVEAGQHHSLLRNHGGGAAPVTYLELFFDLVYVFAVTQLSHFLLGHLTVEGLAQAAILFLAVWWAWIYTTWAANWADPERLAVRVMLIVAMLFSLVMAVALPTAFEDSGLLFVASYAAIQVGRTAMMVLIMRRESPSGARNMTRILSWFLASLVPWLAGCWAGDAEARMGWWAAALAIEYAGPALLFRTPFLGRSSAADWNISGSHMAERAALFIIIALGEGIVVTGTTYAGLKPEGTTNLAALIAFAGSVAMWWIYFDLGATRGAEHIEHHSQPGRVARNAYTYLHMPIVAGIVITAVADELLLAHPDGHAEPKQILVLCGGIVTYLLGTGLFKRPTSRFGNFPFSHQIGLALTLLLGAWAWIMAPPALIFGALAIGNLAMVAAWEWGSYHGGWVERFPVLRRFLRRRPETEG
jgi:low temperature requirement protein LtrA